ncbi:MAG: DUF3500 domain-containing protein [Planctomycetaceae bacterium]|jgi:hypothetical protein
MKYEFSTRHGDSVNRRDFLRKAGEGAAAFTVAGAFPTLASEGGTAPTATSETIVRHLYESLTPGQKEAVCFSWDHEDRERGLLRTHVANNWNITDAIVNSDFYTDDQRRMIRDIFEGIIQPEWHARIDQQLDDDAGGFGEEQSLAIFGNPGAEQFEFVMTGRHMTMRCDGNSTDHMAFGGPIFYGHAAAGFNEGPDHKGNVFWDQALAANRVYDMLDGKQRKLAATPRTPREGQAAFRGRHGRFDGIPIPELSSDQKKEVERVLTKLIEPYRQTDQDEVRSCLKAQGGLDACCLAFYTDNDIGDDRVWDNWRLEGPSFVWHFRGSPHVHVWVNIADSSEVPLNAPGGRGRPGRRSRQ